MSLEHLLWVFLMSAAPVSELRGAIPTGLFGFHLPWYYTFLAAIAGNILPVPFLLLFLGPLSKLLSRIKVCDRILQWIFERTRRRGKSIEKYEKWGLSIFVAVPLPGTGAWTGALVAFLFGMKSRSALLSISLGVLIAGIVVTAFCLLGWEGYLLLK